VKFRKSFDGLALIVEHRSDVAAISGALFVTSARKKQEKNDANSGLETSYEPVFIYLQ
jgi:hypothetical protein